MKIRNRKLCPVCSSGNIKYFIGVQGTHGKKEFKNKKKYNYWKCNECTAIFLKEIELENRKYLKHYFQIDEKIGFLKSHLERKYSYFNNIIKKRTILAFINRGRGKSIMDIGCGSCMFLDTFPDDWEKIGTDILEDKKIIKRENIVYLYGDVLKIDIKKNNLSVITMWHVLEHINDPVNLLNKCNTILGKRGYIFLSTPNSNSYGMSLGRENWFHFDAPRHSVLYNKKSIQALANRTNYDVVKEFYYPFEFPLDLYWSIRKSKCRYVVSFLYPIFKLLDRETIVYVLKRRK